MKEEIEQEAIQTLTQIFRDYTSKGLISIYFWGSIITPDFNPRTSDIDSVGILADDADFPKFDEMRDWLPTFNPKLLRLQINFFYLSELTGSQQVRSRLARLHSPAQAIVDVRFWKYVIGEKINMTVLPDVSKRQYLEDQVQIVLEREKWVNDPSIPHGFEYYCKSLIWLCWAINKLSYDYSAFSWQTLQDESRTKVSPLVR